MFYEKDRVICKYKPNHVSLYIAHCIVDCLSHIVDVLAVESNHCDPSVLHHVHVVVVDQMQALSFVQAGVREHSDLVGNMLPGSWGLELFKARSHLPTHLDDTLSDSFKFGLPFVEKGLVI